MPVAVKNAHGFFVLQPAGSEGRLGFFLNCAGLGVSVLGIWLFHATLDPSESNRRPVDDVLAGAPRLIPWHRE